MKTKLCLVSALLAPGTLLATSIITPTPFYNPDFRAGPTAATSGVTSGISPLAVDNTAVSGTMASGSVSWTHSAGGFAQVRAAHADLLGTATIDAQLAAYTKTVGDSLVFGREITTTVAVPVIGLDVSGDLTTLANEVAGAGIDYQWESNSTVSSLSIVKDQLYQVNFTITPGGGLPADVLSSASFGITTSGITADDGSAANTLNLLDVIDTGTGYAAGNYSFTFKSDSNLSALTFNFQAETVADVNGLGGTAPNQNVLTFSNFEVMPIPETNAFVLCCIAVSLFIFRRRRLEDAKAKSLLQA